jgi:hypothetical protein
MPGDDMQEGGDRTLGKQNLAGGGASGQTGVGMNS